MVLSNKERQARYRQRLKDLAARSSDVSQVMIELLARTRVSIREWKRQIARYEEGTMKIFAGSLDQSSEQVARLRQMVEENAGLVALHDPDGLTADGNIELGDISPCRPSELIAGQSVTHILDEQGLAAELHLFPVEEMARTYDAAFQGRFVGVVGDDCWSIVPLDQDSTTGVGNRWRVEPDSEKDEWFQVIRYPEDRVVDKGRRLDVEAGLLSRGLVPDPAVADEWISPRGK